LLVTKTAKTFAFARAVAVAMSKAVRSVSLCPFDGLPCDHVSSCDDVMELIYGLVLSFNCSRAVVKAGKK